MNANLGRWAVPAVLCAMLPGTLTGCQTTGRDRDETRLLPAARIPFTPYMARVPLQAGDGPYPNLFTGASYAVWGGNAAGATAMGIPAAPGPPSGESEMDADPRLAVTEALPAENGTGGPNGDAKAAMEDSLEEIAPDETGGVGGAPPAQLAMNTYAMSGGPVVVACYLESQFSDMSIAYDAVGLRGIQFHLQLPDGTEVLPVQKVLDGELTEEPVGALRRYGRKLTLYFPGRVILVDNPAVTPAAQGVRLVLEGHGTRFYFEWPARPETAATVKPPRWDQDALRQARSAYRDVSARAKRLSHEFD